MFLTIECLLSDTTGVIIVQMYQGLTSYINRFRVMFLFVFFLVTNGIKLFLLFYVLFIYKQNELSFAENRPLRLFRKGGKLICFFLEKVVITSLSISECDLPGYDYDISSRTCLKFNSTQLNWYDARQHCIDEGGDLITVETVEKLYFHNTSLNNCKS